MIKDLKKVINYCIPDRNKFLSLNIVSFFKNNIYYTNTLMMIG